MRDRTWDLRDTQPMSENRIVLRQNASLAGAWSYKTFFGVTESKCACLPSTSRPSNPAQIPQDQRAKSLPILTLGKKRRARRAQEKRLACYLVYLGQEAR